MLSICIPTLNRPGYLYKALVSVYHQKMDSIEFEVCISNNNSDADYSEVELFIDKIGIEHKNIRYIRQKERKSIDEHMHDVIKMAGGDYLYLLGDDDFFEKDAFGKLSELIANKVDLAVLNANWVDADGKFLFPVHDTPVRLDGLSIYEKYLALYNKCTFGALLVRKKLIRDDYFRILYHTSHAYSCFWLEILNSGNDYKVVFQKGNPVVNLRSAEKNYNLVNVVFKDVHLYFKMLLKHVKNEEGRSYIYKAYKKYKERNASIRFLCLLQKKGFKINQISYADRMQNTLYFQFKKYVSYIFFKCLVIVRIV